MSTQQRADIQVVVSDLTQADSVFSLVDELRRRDLLHKVTMSIVCMYVCMYVCVCMGIVCVQVAVLVNNAGVGLYGPFQQGAVSEALSVLQVNSSSLPLHSSLFFPFPSLPPIFSSSLSVSVCVSKGECAGGRAAHEDAAARHDTRSRLGRAAESEWLVGRRPSLCWARVDEYNHLYVCVGIFIVSHRVHIFVCVCVWQLPRHPRGGRGAASGAYCLLARWRRPVPALTWPYTQLPRPSYPPSAG